MAYNQFTCDASGTITGWSNNCSVRVGAPAKLFIADYDHEFATETAANDPTQWASDIIAGKIHPLPLIEEYEDNSEGATKFTGITGAQKVVKKGKISETYRIELDPCLHVRLQGLNGKKARIYMVDVNNNHIGTTPDKIKYKGRSIESFDIENIKLSDGSNLSFTQFSFSYDSNLESNKELAIFEADFNIKELNGIQPATLTEVSSSATDIVVTVAGACDGVAITGLTTNDFAFIEASGTEETINTIVEDPLIPGKYTLSATAFVTGALHLYNQTDNVYVITVGSDYYKGLLAVTIS